MHVFCLQLLRACSLHTHTVALHMLPSDTCAGAGGTRPRRPAGPFSEAECHASPPNSDPHQLLSCLQVLAARGHAALLDLPPAVFKPELEPFVAAVFRHILEDPATLQVRS